MQAVASPVRSWLRLEALSAAAAGLLVWVGLDGGWGWFALLIFAPDLSMLGYVWGPKIGASVYNVVHSYAIPLVIGVAGGVLDQRSLLLTSALWITHVGVDRALGFGLKYPTGFRDTHLGELQGRQLHALQRSGEQLTQQLMHHPDATGSAQVQ